MRIRHGEETLIEEVRTVIFFHSTNCYSEVFISYFYCADFYLFIFFSYCVLTSHTVVRVCVVYGNSPIYIGDDYVIFIAIFVFCLNGLKPKSQPRIVTLQHF